MKTEKAPEYAVQNFSYVPSGFNTETIQADYSDIQIFMDVTRSFMESVDWVERYFWFGAMYEMVSSLLSLSLTPSTDHCHIPIITSSFGICKVAAD